jgi:hypothetical protein
VDCARGPAMWTLGFPSTDHGVDGGGNEIHVNVVKMTTGEVGHVYLMMRRCLRQVLQRQLEQLTGRFLGWG